MIILRTTYNAGIAPAPQIAPWTYPWTAPGTSAPYVYPQISVGNVSHEFSHLVPSTSLCSPSGRVVGCAVSRSFEG